MVEFRYTDKKKEEHVCTYKGMTCLEALEQFGKENPDQIVQHIVMDDKNWKGEQ